MKKTERIYGKLTQEILSRSGWFKVKDFQHPKRTLRIYLSQLVKKGKLEVMYKNNNQPAEYRVL